MSDRKRWIGFSYAWNGLIEVWKSERNFRFHCFAALVVIIAGIFFQIQIMEWVLLFICIGFVMVTEMLNTAIEKFLDYVKPAIHPQAKIIKDIAAGAVLLASIVALISGVFIFFPKVFHLLF